MKINKPGILDSFQDMGRFGYAHLGVGQGGCMDQYAAQLANLIVGNSMDDAVLEMHFPAPVLEFTEPVTIALTGGDFSARVSGIIIPNNRRISLPAHSTLTFSKKVWGQRGYLAVQKGWRLDKIMGSYSTHLKSVFGGFNGRALKKGDFIPLAQEKLYPDAIDKVNISNWFTGLPTYYQTNTIRVCKGPEWDWLTEEAIHLLENASFTISPHNDRMGYQLKGLKLKRKVQTELLSSGVLPGTIQLLPNGQPLLLMADSQTTGGYPRILQVIEADLPVVAQKGAGEVIRFELVEVEAAIEIREGRLKELKILKGAFQVF